MLTLQMKSGDYLTINGNIVVHFLRDGPKIQVAIQAPKEIPIVRGTVLERDGQERPEPLLKAPGKRPSEGLAGW